MSVSELRKCALADMQVGWDAARGRHATSWLHTAEMHPLMHLPCVRCALATAAHPCIDSDHGLPMLECVQHNAVISYRCAHT